jgi:hypothetical protein
MHFDKAILDQIHQLNAEIDFDLYNLSGKARGKEAEKQTTALNLLRKNISL